MPVGRAGLHRPRHRQVIGGRSVPSDVLRQLEDRIDRCVRSRRRCGIVARGKLRRRKRRADHQRIDRRQPGHQFGSQGTRLLVADGALVFADGGPGPITENAVDRSGIEPRSLQRVLDAADQERLSKRVRSGRTGGGGGGGGRLRGRRPKTRRLGRSGLGVARPGPARARPARLGPASFGRGRRGVGDGRLRPRARERRAGVRQRTDRRRRRRCCRRVAGIRPPSPTGRARRPVTPSTTAGRTRLAAASADAGPAWRQWIPPTPGRAGPEHSRASSCAHPPARGAARDAAGRGQPGLPAWRREPAPSEPRRVEAAPVRRSRRRSPAAWRVRPPQRWDAPATRCRNPAPAPSPSRAPATGPSAGWRPRGRPRRARDHDRWPW